MEQGQFLPAVTDGLLELLGASRVKIFTGRNWDRFHEGSGFGEAPEGGRGLCSTPRCWLSPRGLQVPGIGVVVAGADQTQLRSHCSVLLREGIPTQAMRAPVKSTD